MEGGNRERWPSRKNLKPRLGWKRIKNLSCCGSSNWVLDTEEAPLVINGDQSPAPETITTTMNLAMALAADRRKMNMGSRDGVLVKPLKSVVRLFEVEERDVKAAEEGRGVIGSTLRCLCTERYKGAALIPCWHTYCRVCFGAMWLKKEPCPLCKRSITEVLELF